MNLLTEFLTTYDELSVLNDTADTDAGLWLSEADLDDILLTKAKEWRSAVVSKFSGQIVSQGIIQFFASQNQQETTLKPLARQLKEALARWQANAVKSSLGSFTKLTRETDYKINLRGSWYGYCFVVHSSITNSQKKQQLVRDCVNTSARYFEVDESDILLYTAKLQQISMYIICVKHDNSANKSTLDNAPKAINMTQKTTAINDADMNNFLQIFITKYPKRIQYETRADGTCIPTAFHVPTLVNFYLEHLEMGSAIRQTLATYFNSVTLEPNPKQSWKSVQYLYNAIQQEFVMGSKLTPNKTATNAGDNVPDSHQYLISGRASSSTDFLHNGLKIEAKQGHYKTGTEVKIDNSHEAAYVFYFAYEGLGEKGIGVHAIAGDWILYRAIPDQTNYFVSVSEPETKAEEELLKSLNDLNETNKTLNLVNLKPKKK
jgi:hypothetical protein